MVCNKCSNYEAQLPYDDNKVNRVCYKCYYIFKGEEEGAKEQSRRVSNLSAIILYTNIFVVSGVFSYSHSYLLCWMTSMINFRMLTFLFVSC